MRWIGGKKGYTPERLAPHLTVEIPGPVVVPSGGVDRAALDLKSGTFVWSARAVIVGPVGDGRGDGHIRAYEHG